MKKIFIIILLLIVIIPNYAIADDIYNSGPEPDKPYFLNYITNISGGQDLDSVNEYWVYFKDSVVQKYFTYEYVTDGSGNVINFKLKNYSQAMNSVKIYKNDNEPYYVNSDFTTLQLYNDTLNTAVAREKRLFIDDFTDKLFNGDLIENRYIYNNIEEYYFVQIKNLSIPIQDNEGNVLVDFIEPEIPKYSIKGQKFYLYNASNYTGDKLPYIKSLQVKALALSKESLGDGNFVNVHTFPRGEKIGFLPKRYILQFQHPENSSILVESNIPLMELTDDMGFEPLDPELMNYYYKDAYGTGYHTTPQNKTYEINSNQTIKITNLRQGVITYPITLLYESSLQTNGLVEWYNTRFTNLRKIKDYKVTEQAVKKEIQLSKDEYIIFTDTTGTSRVTIPHQYIENIDYTIEIIAEYIQDSDAEDEYRNKFPNIPDISDADDFYSKDVSSDFILDIVNKMQGNEMENTIEIVNQSKQLVDIFTEPIKLLFKGVSELYFLIILGFGLSLVTFVLGR